MDTPKEMFYATVLVPEARQTYSKFEPKDFVSPDKSKIIEISRKHKGSRFKGFTSFKEALKFAEDEPEDKIRKNFINSPSANIVAEVAPPFPSVDAINLSKFRREIENNDLSKVESDVNINPRYLISYNNDGPTILMQGARYNAVHIAIRKKSASILRYILETLSSLRFIQRCYPSFDEESLKDKQTHLLDLYLNTPEKVIFDTPLHMACKNGSLECIRILLLYYPMICTTPKNKHQFLPKDVIRNEEVRTEIEELLKSYMYIAVVRSDDNLNVKISQPCKGRQSLDFSIIDRTLSKVSAIVGPMTPEKAKDIYDRLKSPKRCTPEQKSLRLKDPIRGVEKVARDVCYNNNVPFKEYWNFLGDYADFSTKDGFDKINQHLLNKHSEMSMNKLFGKLVLLENLQNGQIIDQCSQPDDLSQPDEGGDCFYDAKIDVEEDDDMFYTPPCSPVCEQIQVKNFFINGEVKSQIDLEVFGAVKSALETNFNSADELMFSHPFFYHWFTKLSNDAQ